MKNKPARYTVTVYYMSKLDAERLEDYAQKHPKEVIESEERGKHTKINGFIRLNNKYTRTREYNFMLTRPSDNNEYSRAEVVQYMEAQAINKAMGRLGCIKNTIVILDFIVFENNDDDF